jgi:FkbM family methyltransferase
MSVAKVVRILGQRVEVSGSDADDYFLGLPDGTDITDNVLVALRRVVTEDSICVDAGANIGLYSLGLSSLAPRGRVLAFEPSVGAMKWLDENLAFNHVANVETFGVALSDRVGTLHFHDVPWFLAGSFTTQDGAYLSSDAVGSTLVDVVSTTLDAFVTEVGIERVDVIKIDVEGAEMAVIDGAARTLAEHRPVVVMEFNSFAFTLHQELLPQHALSRIQEIFPYVFVIDRVDGSLSRLSTPAECYGFLYNNGIHGPTDNLLCSFEDQPVTDDRSLEVAGVHTAPPPPSPPVHPVVAELEAMRRTLSWRVTAPLRAVRRRVNRNGLVHRLVDLVGARRPRR